MEVITGKCPYGGKCERVKIRLFRANVLVRCPMYQKVTGKDPQSEKIVEEWQCSIAWGPILQVQMAQRMIGVQAAIESTRNEIVARQDLLNHFAQPEIEQPGHDNLLPHVHAPVHQPINTMPSHNQLDFEKEDV